MLHHDSKKLQSLIAAFKSAEETVKSVVLKTKADSVEEYKLKVDKKLDSVNVKLTKKSISWANEDMPKAYKEGARQINGSIPRGTHYDETDIANSYIQLAKNVQHATEERKASIRRAIDKAEKENSFGATVGIVKEIIQEELAKDNASMVITYNNGAKMPLAAHAEMLARTSRIIASNTGSFDRCKQLGLDLVKCTTVPNCCPYCKKYEGKVYSISGKDKRFPALYETALKKGYNIMHPNCRHEFLPFHESFVGSPEELEKVIEKSNHFEELDKNDNLFKIYNQEQAKLRMLVQTKKEFEILSEYYGDKFPYKTLRGFRNGWNKNSATLKTIRSFMKLDTEGKCFHLPKKYFTDEERLKAWKFLDKKKANRTFYKATKAIWSKISTKEKVSITAYTDASKEIANYLRTGTFSEYLTEQEKATIIEQTKTITQLLHKCEIPKNIILKRVVSLKVFAEKYLGDSVEVFLDNCENIEYYIDKQIKENSFCSTSVSFDANFDVTKESSIKEKTQNVIMEIYTPKNSKGLYLEPFSKGGGNIQNHTVTVEDTTLWDGENHSGTVGEEIEVLLQRGSVFQIRGFKKNKNGDIVAYVDLVSQTGGSE